MLREAQHSLREEEELMAEQLRAVEATSLAVTSCIQTGALVFCGCYLTDATLMCFLLNNCSRL